VTVEATSPSGAIAIYDAATGIDTADPAPVITYSQASGTLFPIGVTTVTATATDASGNSALASFTVTVTVQAVAINIKPNKNRNVINLNSKGKIRVAILSSAAFDAVAEVDRTSLTFGRTGYEQSFFRCKRKGKDVNGDGLPDLICRFHKQRTGFQFGDTEGILRGLNIAGKFFEGSDSVVIRKRGRRDKADDHKAGHGHGDG
jgi:hypothetical protein